MQLVENDSELKHVGATGQRLCQVSISPAVTGPALNSVQMLQKLLPVQFGFEGRLQAGANAALVLESETAGNPQLGAISSCRLEMGIDGASSEPVALTETEIRFADDPDVPFPFGGRRLKTRIGGRTVSLRPQSRERVLATDSSGPVWTVLVEGGMKRYRCGYAIPGIPLGGTFRDVLSSERFAELLPVIHFLRQVSDEGAFAGPSLKACFMFDDPNLHWPKYGFVDFREIAQRAERENYHVSFATIPLDTWFANKTAADLFRNNRRTLSLLVHGNDHVHYELARDYTDSARSALLVQALQRIGRFEERTGLEVSRIMVPPHGACSEAMLRALPDCGFEGACISHGSLRSHNKGKEWSHSLGYAPSSLVGRCFVLPRWGLTGDPLPTILLAAFLGQPIVLRGHHQELRNGLEVLDERARIINSLGNVSWSNMTVLSRGHYRWRTSKTVMEVEPWSRRLEVAIPGEVRELRIHNRMASDWTWEVHSSEGRVLAASQGELVVLTGPSSTPVTMSAVGNPRTAPSRVGGLSFRAGLRRVLTECRDRLSPLL